MANNQTYEANISSGSREGGRTSYDDDDEYQLGVTASSTGAHDKHLTTSTTEESPLLPNGSENERADALGDASTRWEGEADFEGLPWWRTPSVYWLLGPFLLYSMAFGGILVPRLTLALKLICREYLADKAFADPSFTFAPVLLGQDNPQCRIPEVQALSTKFMLYVSLISGILSALVSPKLGALSDRYGRKPILCFITSGGILSEIVTILAAKYPDTVPYPWLLVGSFFDGICGSFIAGMAITHSYATDCTAPAKRAVAFGYFHASLFSGIAVGPLIAGFVIKATGDVIVIFYIALACHIIYMSVIGFVIPESLSKKRQLAAREKHREEVGSFEDSSQFVHTLRAANFLAPLKILYPTGEGSSAALRANLIFLSMVDTIIFGVAMGAVTVIIYYAEYQFGWEDFETNVFVSITNTCRVSALMIILPLLNYLVRTRRKNRARRETGIEILDRNSGSDNLDLWTIRVSLLFEVIGFAGYALVRTGPLFIMGGVVTSIGGIGAPTLQSALTKHVPHDRTGQLLGATGLLHALARVVCPIIFSLIYASTVKYFPQVVFIVLAGCFGLAFVISCLVKPHVYLEEQGTSLATGLGAGPEERDAERIADEEITGI